MPSVQNWVPIGQSRDVWISVHVQVVQEVNMSGRPNRMRCCGLGLTVLIAVTLFSVCTPARAYAQGNEGGKVETRVFNDPIGLANYQVVSDRSWYGGRVSFSINASTNIRYFDGNSVGIEVQASCPTPGSFTVSLYRGNALISTASLKRNGFSRAEWRNVGPGSYRFVFRKSPDGSTVACSNVAMFSW